MSDPAHLGYVNTRDEWTKLKGETTLKVSVAVKRIGGCWGRDCLLKVLAH